MHEFNWTRSSKGNLELFQSVFKIKLLLGRKFSAWVQWNRKKSQKRFNYSKPPIFSYYENYLWMNLKCFHPKMGFNFISAMQVKLKNIHWKAYALFSHDKWKPKSFYLIIIPWPIIVLISFAKLSIIMSIKNNEIVRRLESTNYA